MTEYGIWLSFNNQEEGFQIPVNPNSIELSDGSKGKTYDVAALGEINVIKDPKLTEYGFSSIFPAQRYPFVIKDPILKPKEYVNYLLKWMGTKRPIRFVFTGATFDINEATSIETFQWKEVAGGGGDIEYSLKLKKYVFYAARKVQVTQQAQGSTSTTKLAKEEPERPTDKQPPKTYTMVSGDTLWSVAKKTLDNGDRWREIQNLNGITDNDLKRLQVGKVLKIPG